jgi:alkanesulfonate monooxygenase SsuD/methylene tetrahydromethanopterin reductase-like flavin-dependent oxidoreductase (luciferase family)
VPDWDEKHDGDFDTWCARLVEECVAADALGFDTVWLAEHLYPGYGFSPLPRLAQAIAAQTRRLRVGTALAPLGLHHPMLDAGHWAAVDVASGGRLSLGIGLGLFSDDAEATGGAPSEARARLEEAWPVIRRLWTEPVVTHVSRYWAVRRMTLQPQPVQKPTPPVYVACAGSPDAYLWAGANGSHVIVAPYLVDSADEQRRLLGLYHDALGRAGYDASRFRVVVNYHLFLVEHERRLGDADRDAIRYRRFLARATALERLDRRDGGTGAVTVRRLETLLRRQTIVGTPSRCLEQMRVVAASCGITDWMLQLDHRGMEHAEVLEQLQRFAEAVMPALDPGPIGPGAPHPAAGDDAGGSPPLERLRRPAE